MSEIRSMGWARISVEKSRFCPTTKAAQNLCSNLSNILVEQLGIAKQISLEHDPATGKHVLNFFLDHNSSLPDKLTDKEIQGLPVRFVH